MNLITTRVTVEDVKGIAADNDIPEAEWTFAISRVTRLEAEIRRRLTKLADELVTDAVLFNELRP